MLKGPRHSAAFRGDRNANVFQPWLGQDLLTEYNPEATAAEVLGQPMTYNFTLPRKRATAA